MQQFLKQYWPFRWSHCSETLGVLFCIPFSTLHREDYTDSHSSADIRVSLGKFKNQSCHFSLPFFSMYDSLKACISAWITVVSAASGLHNMNPLLFFLTIFKMQAVIRGTIKTTFVSMSLLSSVAYGLFWYLLMFLAIWGVSYFTNFLFVPYLKNCW